MRYVKINIPQQLAQKITPYLRSNGGTYRSFSEFALEAIRLRLEQLAKNLQGENQDE